jgi:cytochrome c-type biogenesis protein CcmH
MSVARIFASFVLLVLSAAPLRAAPAPDLDDQTRAIATELRCVVCQNLSVADSPSEMAQQMRAIVREQLQAGKSPDQIKDFFVSKYGEWVLLKPKTTGISALLWILPYVVLVLGVITALWFVRRWVKKKKLAQEASKQAPVTPQVRSELLRDNIGQPDLEDTSPRAQLLRERARLRSELTDLDFDFQSGKLSESDYAGLKQEVETKAAGVIQQLSTLPAKPVVKPRPDAQSTRSPSQFRRWQIVAGGAFLMLFGLALGVMLTKSVRPRESENDTMTGDFLTGTTPASGATRAALNEGKQAFGNQDFPKAIEAFKKVLAADPNNPEAHTY